MKPDFGGGIGGPPLKKLLVGGGIGILLPYLGGGNGKLLPSPPYLGDFGYPKLKLDLATFGGLDENLKFFYSFGKDPKAFDWRAVFNELEVFGTV